MCLALSTIPVRSFHSDTTCGYYPKVHLIRCDALRRPKRNTRAFQTPLYLFHHRGGGLDGYNVLNELNPPDQFYSF